MTVWQFVGRLSIGHTKVLQIPGVRIRRQENPGDRRALINGALWSYEGKDSSDLTTKDQRKLLVFIGRKQLLEVLTLCSLFLKKLVLL